MQSDKIDSNDFNLLSFVPLIDFVIIDIYRHCNKLKVLEFIRLIRSTLTFLLSLIFSSFILAFNNFCFPQLYLQLSKFGFSHLMCSLQADKISMANYD